MLDCDEKGTLRISKHGELLSTSHSHLCSRYQDLILEVTFESYMARLLQYSDYPCHQLNTRPQHRPSTLYSSIHSTAKQPTCPASTSEDPAYAKPCEHDYANGVSWQNAERKAQESKFPLARLTWQFRSLLCQGRFLISLLGGCPVRVPRSVSRQITRLCKTVSLHRPRGE